MSFGIKFLQREGLQSIVAALSLRLCWCGEFAVSGSDLGSRLIFRFAKPDWHATFRFVKSNVSALQSSTAGSNLILPCCAAVSGLADCSLLSVELDVQPRCGRAGTMRY